MKYRRVLPLLFTLVAMLMAAMPAGAQTPESYLDLNAWHCPSGYAQISDCTRLGDVYVDVRQDGQPFAQVSTKATEGTTLDLMWGAFIELSIAGGVPERTYLEDTTLSFDAVEGANAVTLIFVDQEAVPPPHSDANALVVEVLVCPVEYAGNNYGRDCVGEAEIGATVTRDVDGFTTTGTTGVEGLVGFQGLGEGTYTVELGVPGDFASFLTVCGTPDGFEPRQVTNPDTNRIGVYLGPNETLTCTFFVIPVDAVGAPAQTPAPAQPTTAGPVTRLPSTGAGDTGSSDNVATAFWYTLGTSFLLAGASTLIVRRQRD